MTRTINAKRSTLMPTALCAAALVTACGGSGSEPPSGSTTGPGPTSDVLQAPAAGEGFQIITPTFTLHPGDEVFKCFYTSIPSDADITVGRFVSKMAKGSHHFILFQFDQASQPDGTIVDCGGGVGPGGGTSLTSVPIWVYAAAQIDNHMDMPSGVGMPFKAHQPVMFNMHYFNTGNADLTGHVTLNIELTHGDVQTAGSFISFNTSIAIPPNGTQTVSGHCTPPAGAQFFLMGTHTHSHAVEADINRYSNGQIGEQLVKTLDWEHPTINQYDAPFITFAQGEELYYSCNYKNDSGQTITVGQSAIKNEMCMAVTYYFPATGRAFCR